MPSKQPMEAVLADIDSSLADLKRAGVPLAELLAETPKDDPKHDLVHDAVNRLGVIYLNLGMARATLRRNAA